MDFVLASGSASRRRILTEAGITFAAVLADIDEETLKGRYQREGTAASQIAGRLAEAKALAVSAARSGALVLGADQTLLFEGAVVSKCSDLAAARLLLRRLRGHEHLLVGGYVLAHGGEVVWRHRETAHLVMRNFSDAFLDGYLAAEGQGVLSAVGCYKLEGRGMQLFEKVEGDYFSILGLALQPLLAELRAQGVLQS
ncbi:MAG TPA: Maf family protein [Rhizomicrobium sp.]|nr:Maf family protein [Rhizomicrobium sp.]